MEWTFEDQEKALKEGWGVFLVNGDPNKPEIQKYDEYTGSCPLITDFDALDWVMRVSRKYGGIHQKALEVCNIKEQDRHPWNRIAMVEICFWREVLVRFYTAIDIEGNYSYQHEHYKKNYPLQQHMNFLMTALHNMSFVASVDVENHMVIFKHPSLLRKEQK